MQFSRALFFFLLLCVIFFWRAISCATILFNIKNRSWGTPLAPLFSTGRCACNVPNRPTPLPSPHYTSVNLKTQLYFYGQAYHPTIHSNPSRKRSSWKRSSNLRNLKTLAFRFHVVGKYFESDDVDGELLMCCQSLLVSRFLRRRVDVALVTNHNPFEQYPRAPRRSQRRAAESANLFLFFISVSQ